MHRFVLIFVLLASVAGFGQSSAAKPEKTAPEATVSGVAAQPVSYSEEVAAAEEAIVKSDWKAAEAKLDLWLAAQAIQTGFKLLTSNEKDFRDIPGLDLVLLRF